MRVWSLHPQYLDRQGLLGLWVESLLCQKVLAGRTKGRRVWWGIPYIRSIRAWPPIPKPTHPGYTNHPQLTRWRSVAQPLVAMGLYLSVVCQEGQRRGYNMNASLILHAPPVHALATTTTLLPSPVLEVRR